MKVSVLACVLRRDNQFLVTYRSTPGAITSHALSPVEVRVGSDAIIRNGKVVKS